MKINTHLSLFSVLSIVCSVVAALALCTTTAYTTNTQQHAQYYIQYNEHYIANEYLIYIMNIIYYNIHNYSSIISN